MPIRPENKGRYPIDWPAIRTRILARADNRCEFCEVPNHALGGRDDKGRWYDADPLGNYGRGSSGLVWPKPGEHALCRRGAGRAHVERLRIIRIVLTIAHLDHTPENCSDDNLRALCQRCHLRHDAEHHLATRARTMHAQRAIADLFEEVA